jgi:16S rRNA processing protein RimM
MEADSARGPTGPDPARGAGSLVAVGRVVRPQGRHGEVRLEPLTDAPDRLRDLRECWLVPPPEGERRKVEAVRLQGGIPVMQLGGVAGLDDAARLVGRLVAIPRAAVRPLPPGRFYAFDLVGCAVETPEGRGLGAVADVLAGAGHDFWAVRRDGQEWLLPAVAAIVERVDLAGRRIVVRPPEGLVELDAR